MNFHVMLAPVIMFAIIVAIAYLNNTWSETLNLDTVNSKLDWNDKLAAIFEAKLVINRLSSSVLFYCFSRHG